ncbi:MAG: alanyl-tRNA editing protein [Gemmatimonadota bacterium]
MPTERLYYTDSYLREFSANVLRREDGGRRLYLDRTAFYPTSGGQPFDTGQLAGARVVDVVDEGDEIAHVLDAPAHETAVTGLVDWPRRFDHMQQHTGQHLLSAIFADRFGWPTVSVHFGAEVSTLDLDTGAITWEDARAAELAANAAVVENRPVTVTFEDAATAAGLRKPPDRDGVLRIIDIGGIDRSACGGTHVRATGEIGPVLIRKLDRIRKQVRIEFVCGGRAVRAAQRDHAAVTAMAALLSASPADLPALVEAQREQLKEQTAERRRLAEELAGCRARELHAAAMPDSEGRRVVVQQVSGALDDVRPLALGVAGLPGGVYVAVSAAPPALLVAAAEDSGVEANALLQRALEPVGGKGGGSPRLAQGRLPNAAAAGVVLELVRSLL